jgi:hypothetical protein
MYWHRLPTTSTRVLVASCSLPSQTTSSHSCVPTDNDQIENDKTTRKLKKRKEKRNIKNNTHRKGVRKEETKNQVTTMTFFPKMESSLQRAAAKGRASETKPASEPTKEGAFESCFASGLDLSEFSSGGTQSQLSRPSAAAELLRVKQEEIKQKEQEEEEETRMGLLVKNRVSQLEESIEKKKLGGHSSENMVVNALINMHGNDDAASKDKIRKATKKTKASSRPSPRPQKSKAVKKSRRSKY